MPEDYRYNITKKPQIFRLEAFDLNGRRNEPNVELFGGFSKYSAFQIVGINLSKNQKSPKSFDLRLWLITNYLFIKYLYTPYFLKTEHIACENSNHSE
jgi:hypothetical protein